ncbi:MAG: hypothetical protein K2K37_07745, partial [Muribaculaceae bacterium]|nr:hypothetical protein [Muribaculaceae bacterium]
YRNMILLIIAIAVIMCIIILCVIILGIAILGVIALIMLGVAKLIMLLVVLGISSFTQTYTEQDFADSRWEDSAGTVIELYSDGTCNVRYIKWNLIIPSDWLEDSTFLKRHPHPRSFVGRWIIRSNQDDEQEIVIETEIDGRWNYATDFLIEDINVIKQFIGDPDNWEFYTLTRTQ